MAELPEEHRGVLGVEGFPIVSRGKRAPNDRFAMQSRTKINKKLHKVIALAR